MTSVNESFQKRAAEKETKSYTAKLLDSTYKLWKEWTDNNKEAAEILTSKYLAEGIAKETIMSNILEFSRQDTIKTTFKTFRHAEYLERGMDSKMVDDGKAEDDPAIEIISTSILFGLQNNLQSKVYRELESVITKDAAGEEHEEAKETGLKTRLRITYPTSQEISKYVDAAWQLYAARSEAREQREPPAKEVEEVAEEEEAGQPPKKPAPPELPKTLIFDRESKKIGEREQEVEGQEPQPQPKAETESWFSKFVNGSKKVGGKLNRNKGKIALGAGAVAIGYGARYPLGLVDVYNWLENGARSISDSVNSFAGYPAGDPAGLWSNVALWAGGLLGAYGIYKGCKLVKAKMKAETLKETKKKKETEKKAEEEPEAETKIPEEVDEEKERENVLKEYQDNVLRKPENWKKLSSRVQQYLNKTTGYQYELGKKGLVNSIKLIGEDGEPFLKINYNRGAINYINLKPKGEKTLADFHSEAEKDQTKLRDVQLPPLEEAPGKPEPPIVPWDITLPRKSQPQEEELEELQMEPWQPREPEKGRGMLNKLILGGFEVPAPPEAPPVSPHIPPQVSVTSVGERMKKGSLIKYLEQGQEETDQKEVTAGFAAKVKMIN